jgi:hypothetical protein
MASNRSRTDHQPPPADYHDPTRGLGGAPPASSALGARLAFAILGFIICIGFAVGIQVAGRGVVWATAVLCILAVIALIDISVVLSRIRHGRGA